MSISLENRAAQVASVADWVAGVEQAPPGVCIAISQGDCNVTESRGVVQAFDAAGPVAGMPIGPHTRVDLGSVTKVLVTTYATMVLLERGEISLERSLGELTQVDAALPASSASLQMLLEHRAGLWEWWPLYLSHEHATGRRAALAAAMLELRYPRDRARHYSDLGFILLGEALATVCAADFVTVAKELVLNPLALVESSLAKPCGGAAVAASSNGDAIERKMVATGEPYPVRGTIADFDRWRNHVLVGEVNDGNAFHSFGGCAGHAGAFSTASDLLRYGQLLLTCLAGDGPLRADTVRRFLTPGGDPIQGLGFRRWVLNGYDWWGHTGFPGVAIAFCPATGIAVALVTNRLHVHGEPRPTEPMLIAALRAVTPDSDGGADGARELR